MGRVDAFVSGEIPLVKTFWLLGVFAWVALHLPAIYVHAIDYKGDMGNPLDTFLIFFDLMVFGYTIVSCIAIWRSSEIYQGATIWAFLAKWVVVMVLGSKFLVDVTAWL